ncbi:MAG TPA: hypothetical protein VK184_22110 [Nostocaceae cyanobacterium]|nr:hypothetical protein [Nostocaceae cyanobacterium]
MPLSLLITLISGLATSYLFRHNQDEINYIAGVFTAICCILSLILAPWQFQLGTLILVLIGTRKFLPKS